uniref:Uncharacterized protein n=1 Tax=Mucochytrium quahogii TaxID=96639 RepID=A0A7S2RV43_9STRA|mmetsp:Transcript_17777/g.28775  ORF Transcript_17777/g.28775 Transcript_17777/m.28775 type:complete len:345 (+) Transcript_17777:155-1189(+)|eukprot:CAMPEP_0203761310 /NCGR_PEP_ID=MMETSP0098-20131031/14418_1 /ASSEMBLY_ACC=CAM_ASM_000208 /TAXON_ID=96639 /ORGANISM=" , Strain NY0313808BC1" /LENGTH=344 /DNA_ID=CAMNT_0050655237 /DNA_START=133 /DNA_END=1167 /DNA_ORIENTATION=-
MSDVKRIGQQYTAVVEGRGVPVGVFVQIVAVSGCILFLLKNHPDFGFVYTLATSRGGLAVCLSVLGWIIPLKELAYVIDRLGAIRAQLHNLAPFGVDLLPTLPDMLPFLPMVIDNIERVGPFLPLCMQDGVKEHVMPLLPEMMPDLEMFLDEADTVGPLLPKLAPHMKEIMPYTLELIPYIKELACVIEVDGWWQVNPYMDKLVPHIAKLAPHSQVLAKHLPEMLPYMDVMIKYIDNLVDELEETIEVMDQLVPLFPLLPVADQAGLLSQKFAFKMLPTVVGLIPLSNETTGKGAVVAAHVHGMVLRRAYSVKDAVMDRVYARSSSDVLTLTDDLCEPESEKDL